MDSRTQVRERIAAIMTTKEAKAHPVLAEHIAYNTDMTPVEALATLRAHIKGAQSSDSHSYEERKLKAGALGLARVASASAADAWDRAVESVNRGIA